MKLKTLRLCNFQSFGDTPTTIDFVPTTFLLGPNGSGKTALLQATARLFAVDYNLRRIQKSDFHIPSNGAADGEELSLWIEADFEFPELKDAKGKHPTVPSHFAHMRLESDDAVPIVRFRLDATQDAEGQIEESLNYVLQSDEDGEPTKKAAVPKHNRNSIQVHYLPARRDPNDHISYAASSLLGRILRAATWKDESKEVGDLAQKMSSVLNSNSAILGFNEQLAKHWGTLHRGTYYSDPSISFEQSQIDSLLRHLTVAFKPGIDENIVDFSRLGDGQKSLLYISLVIAAQEIGRKVLSKEITDWDIERLHPALFTVVAIEEPENSLSPHYLGRVIAALSDFAEHDDAQSIVATHSPSLLRRVAPEHIRYLRLNTSRETVVTRIMMPAAEHEAHKFVREAVQAFPELYFSRLVVLGEGDSEEIVLPRLLHTHGLSEDNVAVVVVPLGGRHVNHFWRLLHHLKVPYVTLLDLDLGRYQGGWGRVRYVAKQLRAFPPSKSKITEQEVGSLPKWDGTDNVLTSVAGKKWIKRLEECGVFFSSPLDLDFAMLRRFLKAYGVEDDELQTPDQKTVLAVLGPKSNGMEQYNKQHQKLFNAYYARFKLDSKPAQHLSALANVDDADLKTNTPSAIVHLLAAVKEKLTAIPE